MGNELGKLLGRDFFIGFFLPALFFCGGNWLLWEYLNHPTELGAHAKEIGENALLTGLGVWIFAILLQAVNRQLFRFAEGYWPGRSWLAWRQRRRFRSLQTKLDRLKKERATAQEKNEEFSKMGKLMRSWHKLVVHFPSDEAGILPTRFGNVAAAYEDYSRAVYGFESTRGWCRVQEFFSKQFATVLAKDRAQIDLWLNIWVLAIIFALETVGIAVCLSRWDLVYAAPIFLLIALIANRYAQASAVEFGEDVKSAFDLYLPLLAKRLGYELSWDRQINRKFWQAFSQLMIYHYPESLDDMRSAGLTRIAEDKAPEKSDDENSDDD